jgi:hypothetical protein
MERIIAVGGLSSQTSTTLIHLFAVKFDERRVMAMDIVYIVLSVMLILALTEFVKNIKKWPPKRPNLRLFLVYRGLPSIRYAPFIFIIIALNE